MSSQALHEVEERPTPARGHVLTVTRGPDWFEDQHDWAGSIACVDPDVCGGWIECGEDHTSYDPHDQSSVTFDRLEGVEIHGVIHEWRGESGWTVPYDGCVAERFPDYWVDDVWTIGQKHGAGAYFLDDEWHDPGECGLIFIKEAGART